MTTSDTEIRAAAVPLSRRRFNLSLAAASLTAGVRGVHAAEPLSRRPLADGLGVVVKFSQGQPPSQIDLLPRLGVKWVRDAVLWDQMEPRAGAYLSFPPDFEARLRRYRDWGIGVVYMLGYANGKAYPATRETPLAPIDAQALGRYAAHVTRLLRQAGVAHVLEVWNEPHNFQVLKMVGGAWNGRPPSPWVDHYVNMVRAVTEHVHEVAATTEVITSEDVLVNHYWFAQHPRLPRGFKGIGLHAYADASSPGPEVVAPYPDSDWTRPFQLVDRDRAFTSALERLRQHTRRHTGVTPDVWITEWGFKIGDAHPGGPITEDLVAAFLPRAFILSEAAGVKALCWFSMHDSVDGAYGLVGRNGQPRAAFRSFEALNRLIGDHALSQRLSPDGRQTRGLQSYLFTRGSARTLVVWNADNEPVPVPLDPAWSPVEVLDLNGASVNIDSAGSPGLLRIGAAPVYIRLGPTGQATWPPRRGA